MRLPDGHPTNDSPTHDTDTMTLTDVVDSLGLTTDAMVFNWFMSAAPPNAYLTPEGGWYFKRPEVESVRQRLAELRARNERGDLALPDVDDTGPVPLL